MAMTTVVDTGAPLHQRLLAWAHERFPPANILAAVLVWAAAYVWGRALIADPPPVAPRDFLGAFASVGFFLMLRVFDEHKDYAADCATFGERVLQRGVITLRHLKVVGAVALLVQLAASLVVDQGVGPVTMMWLVVVAFSLIMAREFFVGEWLRPRLMLYALSHMLAMPLAVYWLMRMGVRGAALPTIAGLLPVVSYLTGFAFEIARKLRAPAEERAHVDSYTRVLGTQRAPVVLGWVVTGTCVGFAVLVGMIAEGGVRHGAMVAIAVALALGWTTALRFRSKPSPATARACEVACGLVVALTHLALIGSATLVSAGW